MATKIKLPAKTAIATKFGLPKELSTAAAGKPDFASNLTELKAATESYTESEQYQEVIEAVESTFGERAARVTLAVGQLRAAAKNLRAAADLTFIKYDAKAALATKYPFINDRLALTDGDRDAVGKQLQAAAKSLTSFEEQLTELELVPNTTEAYNQTLLITCKLQAALEVPQAGAPPTPGYPEPIHEVERLTSEIASLEQQRNEANAQLEEATKALTKHAEALSEEKERIRAIEAELKAERQRFVEKYAKVKRDLSNAEDELRKTRRRSEPSPEALTSRFMDFLKTFETPNKRARTTDN
ncbi:hypothetical protein PLESTM_000785900 [Pleodorina starrii]|nr:hypothetical protein PLESTM_000785900 [Pleodorina starrii]